MVKKQTGIILLECLCVLSLLAFIIMTTQPLWQLVKRQVPVGESLAMVQAVLPVVLLDITASDTCTGTKQALRLETLSDDGNLIDYIEYQFQNQQFIRKKNGGYERVGVDFSGEFQVKTDQVTLKFIFEDASYEFSAACQEREK
ncbi:MAG: hypothetical protein ACRCWD_06945 [Culicoidibacterales bacterium]